MFPSNSYHSIKPNVGAESTVLIFGSMLIAGAINLAEGRSRGALVAPKLNPPALHNRCDYDESRSPLAENEMPSGFRSEKMKMD